MERTNVFLKINENYIEYEKDLPCFSGHLLN